MLLFDPKSWPPHRPWMVFFLTATASTAVVYFGFAHAGDRAGWPGGASLPGLLFGGLGGVLILFEFLLWFRKKVRVWRVGRAQTWMRAHIWLGLLCAPLLIFHSGFRLGGPLSAVLMVLLLIVIASGVWGLILQQLLPTRMLEEIPAETIYSQIDRLAERLSAEARQVVGATCGMIPDGEARDGQEDGAPVGFVVVGAVRTAGAVQGKVLETRVAPAVVAGAEPLWIFYQETLDPFLRGRAAAGSPLRLRERATRMFSELKARVPPAAHPVADTLASLCDQRRQWDQQIRLHSGCTTGSGSISRCRSPSSC